MGVAGVALDSYYVETSAELSQDTPSETPV